MRRVPGLLLAVVMFLVLDLGVLGINYWISWQVEVDAVAINLAGRQRMLSQRLTKTLLLLDSRHPGVGREEILQELRLTHHLFDQTLQAFAQGGTATGGDMRSLQLAALDEPEAARIVRAAQAEWQVLSVQVEGVLSAPTDSVRLATAAHAAVTHNLSLLTRMNELTSRIEYTSLASTRILRTVQTVAFILAALNFVFIVRLLLRRYQDVTGWMERYEHLANHDVLTGLPNRRHFQDVSEEALRRTAGQGQLGLAVIDLDGFKAANDRYGHQVGDRILQVVGQRLTRSVRADDFIARTGGDEFVALFRGIQAGSQLEHMGERLLAALAEPLHIDGIDIPLGASIGLALYPRDADSFDALFRAADGAMYQVKAAGGHAWRVATVSSQG